MVLFEGGDDDGAAGRKRLVEPLDGGPAELSRVAKRLSQVGNVLIEAHGVEGRGHRGGVLEAGGGEGHGTFLSYPDEARRRLFVGFAQAPAASARRAVVGPLEDLLRLMPSCVTVTIVRRCGCMSNAHRPRPGGRDMRIAPLLFVAAVAAALPAAALAQAQNCHDVQWRINSEYHNAGYCFRTTDAIREWGNAGCRYHDTRDIPLSRDARGILPQSDGGQARDGLSVISRGIRQIALATPLAIAFAGAALSPAFAKLFAGARRPFNRNGSSL